MGGGKRGAEGGGGDTAPSLWLCWGRKAAGRRCSSSHAGPRMVAPVSSNSGVSTPQCPADLAPPADLALHALPSPPALPLRALLPPPLPLLSLPPWSSSSTLVPLTSPLVSAPSLPLWPASSCIVCAVFSRHSLACRQRLHKGMMVGTPDQIRCGTEKGLHSRKRKKQLKSRGSNDACW